MKQLLAHNKARHAVLAKTLTPYTGNRGFYSAVCPEPGSREIILDCCHRLGMPVTEEEEFHCTVIYSPEVALPLDVVARNLSMSMITAWVVGFELFGKEKDVLVMTLASPELARLNRKWQALGCKATFPDYRAHVTLSTRPPLPSPEQLITATAAILNNPPIYLTFEPEQVEDIS